MGHRVQDQDTPAATLNAESAAAVAETLQALASPTRLLILAQLRQAPATVSQLTVELGLEQPAVSHQLRLLRMMGLVTASRSGRSVTYALFDQHVAALLDEAVFHAEHLRLGRPDGSPPAI